MNFFRFKGVFGEASDEVAMARRPIDRELVAKYLELLNAAGIDKDAFSVAIDSLNNDIDVRAAEIIAIATAYNRGGAKPSSKAKALAMLRKRHVELVRNAAKQKIAEKARPW